MTNLRSQKPGIVQDEHRWNGMYFDSPTPDKRMKEGGEMCGSIFGIQAGVPHSVGRFPPFE